LRSARVEEVATVALKVVWGRGDRSRPPTGQHRKERGTPWSSYYVRAEEDGLLLPLDSTAGDYSATPTSAPQLLREREREREDVRREREKDGGGRGRRSYP
jgi:hypothetical protein